MDVKRLLFGFLRFYFLAEKLISFSRAHQVICIYTAGSLDVRDLCPRQLVLYTDFEKAQDVTCLVQEKWMLEI